MAEQKDQFLNIVSNAKCTSEFFAPPHSIISVTTKSTVSDALEKLINNHILSILVVDDKTGEFVTIFSMLDFLNHFINSFKEEDMKGLNSKSTFTYLVHYCNLRDERDDVKFEHIVDILGKEISQATSLDPVIMVEDNASLLDAFQKIVTEKAHRIAVYSKENGTVKSIVTQSRMLDYFKSVLQYLPETKETIEELNIGSKDVLSVQEDDIAYSAFKLMKEKKVSGVAVINKDGKLVGNISANDLKFVGFDLSYFSYLSRPAREYLAWLNTTNFSKHPTRNPLLILKQNERGEVLITCTKKDTLADIIKSICNFRIHRIYEVDEAGKPIAVISIYDILALIYHRHSS
jgi:CBS domain-containing protein